MTGSKRRNLWYHLFDVLLNVGLIVLIVAGIRTFLVSPFQVEGNSMVSTLEDNEYIIINKLAYYIGSPERGDIVVFHPPNEVDKFYVKRIIGLPGEEVALRDGNVYLQTPSGEEKISEEVYLDERNIGKTFRHPPGSGNQTEVRYLVPEGHYFVLGDNRQGSLDSRSFRDEEGEKPFITEDAIKGRVWFVALPITKIHALAVPEYSF